MLLSITEIKPTKSGKSVVVKADGKDFFAKPDMGLAAGMTIEAETEDSEYQGKTLVWIKKYKKANGSAASAPSGSAGNLPYMPFVSNTVAHAIAAGCIKNPSEVAAWAKAAIEAVRDLDTPY